MQDTETALFLCSLLPQLRSHFSLFPATMLKFLLFFLSLHSLHLQGLAAAGQEEPLSPSETSFLTDFYLRDVSGSVLKAEAWLREHVLSRYPASGTTSIVVGDTISCTEEQEPKLSLVLLSLKNVHHSLTRWGLERDIKVSVSLTQACYTRDSACNMGSLRLVLEFLESVNSTCVVNSPSINSSPLPGVIGKFVTFAVDGPLKGKTVSRKLYSLGSNSKLVRPYPARPSPLPEIPPETPLHSSIGFSIPAHIAGSPHPPPSSSRPASSHPPPSPLPPITFPFSPRQQPVLMPAMPPLPFTLPPCAPPADDGGAGPDPPSGAAERGMQRLWCVAKPTVPEETLQGAMDYACGEGGGDCGEITPSGSCYYPDTVIAHASYAFNSYWQKNKRNGGTCFFGGTAMLINADPSFLHCKFELS